MAEVFFASVLALRDLFRRGQLIHVIWPPLVALLIWSAIAYAIWSPAKIMLLAHFPDWAWLTSSWLSTWLANTTLLFAFAPFAPFAYFTTILLTANVAMPRMMAQVAAETYPDLARRGNNALVGSLVNTLLVGVIYLVGWLVTLPLLLIPGVLLVLPIAWTAWFNQRVFHYDALAEHATPAERYALLRDGRGGLYWAGGLSAVLAHVPIVNLFVPAWTALLFVHLCLARLRRLRMEGVVWEAVD